MAPSAWQLLAFGVKTSGGKGLHVVAPAHAQPASISTPLAWSELSEAIGPDHFTIDNLRQRLNFLKRDPWAGFFKTRQRL